MFYKSCNFQFQIDDNSAEQELRKLVSQEFKNLISCTEYTVTISLLLNGVVVSTADGQEAVLTKNFTTTPDNSLKPTLELVEASTTSITLDMKGKEVYFSKLRLEILLCSRID